MYLPLDSVIPLLGTCPAETLPAARKDAHCSIVFNSENGKGPKCPTIQGNEPLICNTASQDTSAALCTETERCAPMSVKSRKPSQGNMGNKELFPHTAFWGSRGWRGLGCDGYQFLPRSTLGNNQPEFPESLR